MLKPAPHRRGVLGSGGCFARHAGFRPRGSWTACGRFSDSSSRVERDWDSGTWDFSNRIMMEPIPAPGNSPRGGERKETASGDADRWRWGQSLAAASAQILADWLVVAARQQIDGLQRNQ